MRTARRGWRRPFLSENGRHLRFGEVLLQALALRDSAFASNRGEPEYVGILLAPGIPAVLANLAVLMAGKVPANLNATPPGDIAKAMVEEAGVSMIMTTRASLDRLGCVQ